MKRSARNRAATKVLLGHVDKGSTCSLSVGSGYEMVTVYLLNGDLVAGVSPDDNTTLVRQLRLRGVIDETLATMLQRRIASDEPIFGMLLEKVLAPGLDQALRDRFQENVCRFVTSVSKPKFTRQQSVFVDNFQMGHDTTELIDAMCVLCDRVAELDHSQHLVLGPTAPPDELMNRVASVLGHIPHPPEALASKLPVEHTRALALLLEALEIRVAVHESDLEEELSEPDHSLDDDDLSLLPLDAHRHLPEEDDEDVEDEPTIQSNTLPTPRESAPSGAPASLEAWLSEATAVDEDELDFFSDHDFERGGADEGAFSTSTRNLDKVEVTNLEASDEDEIIEVGEAPTAKFSAPTLEHGTALERLEVANEALQAVVKAFDAAEGAGRGRSVVQLLVDGSPSKFAPLLHDVVVSEDGALPDEMVLRNLYARPPTEHRSLLNNSLVDIIERALSSAADELPDEGFDEVLETVAGYRQKLSL